MNKKLTAAALLALSCSLVAQAEPGKREAFEKQVPVLTGSPVEGFTIGRGTTAYSSSVDGSIYKVDLRSGEGEVLVPREEDFNSVFTDCYKLGMRVDPRSNYLYAAGCFWGNAYVFDADSGEEIAILDVTNFGEVINDIAITRDAVYFTNFSTPFIHRLPLAKNGQMIAGEVPAPIAMLGDNDQDPLASPMTANGIVATPNGDTLVIGDSTTAQIYRIDPLTGHADRIVVEPPLGGFIDGIVMRESTLYILTPASAPGEVDKIQVVELDKELLNGTLVGNIVDPALDGVASGALLGGALYVNNARYSEFPQPTTEYSLTRLKLTDVQK